jgi:hypothetical protein
MMFGCVCSVCVCVCVWMRLRTTDGGGGGGVDGKRNPTNSTAAFRPATKEIEIAGEIGRNRRRCGCPRRRRSFVIVMTTITTAAAAVDR